MEPTSTPSTENQAGSTPNPQTSVPPADQPAPPELIAAQEPTVISPTNPVSGDVPSGSFDASPAVASPTSMGAETPGVTQPSVTEPSANMSQASRSGTEPVAEPPLAAAQTSQPVVEPRTPIEVAPSDTAGDVPGSGFSSVSTPGGGGKRKLWLLGGGIALGLVLISGAVFGLYLPNTPANVYSTGINRSGKALDSLVTSATDKKKLEAYKTSTISGSVDASIGGGHYSGDFTTSFDKANLTGGLNVTLKDPQGKEQALTAKVISQIPTGSVYPNLYFQLNGLKTLGADALMPGVSDYDGKWIAVSSSYLQSIGAQYLKTGDNTKTQLTTEDIAQVARTLSSVSQQYLFSTAKDKAVFEQRSFVGKEQVDGLSTYHYKVGVNVPHAKAYCVAMTNALLSTDAYKKLAGQDAAQITKQKQSASKDCDQSVGDSVKATDTFDLWIDGHYKLIYKFRVYDKSDKGIYTDVGQIYKGGDKLSLFVKIHDTKGKSDGAFTLDSNLATNQTDGMFTYKSTSTDSPMDVTVKLKAVISQTAVDTTIPSGAVPIEDILKRFGLSPAASTGVTGTTSINEKAGDTEQQTDIRTLQAHIEAAYASNGVYPSLVELNDAAWRKDNMSGADSAAFAPPKSTATKLAANASTTQYGYAPTACDADGCQAYTLSALLSDGTKFTLNNL